MSNSVPVYALCGLSHRVNVAQKYGLNSDPLYMRPRYMSTSITRAAAAEGSTSTTRRLQLRCDQRYRDQMRQYTDVASKKNNTAVDFSKMAYAKYRSLQKGK